MHDEGSEDDEKLLLEISKAHLTEEYLFLLLQYREKIKK